MEFLNSLHFISINIYWLPELCLGMHGREENQDSDLTIKRTSSKASSVIGVSRISWYCYASSLRKALLLPPFYVEKPWIKKLVTGGKGWSQKLLVCVRFCHLISFMFSLKCLFNTTLTSCYTSGLEKNIRRIAGSKYSSSLQISSGPLHWNLMPAVLWFFSLPFQICVIFLLVFFC